MVKQKEEKPPWEQKEVPPMCMVGKCTRHYSANYNVDGFWMVLCFHHHNMLTSFLIDTPAHKNWMKALGNYRAYLSGFPSTTGLAETDSVVDEMLEAERTVRDVINLWLYDHRNDEGKLWDLWPYSEVGKEDE